MPKLERFHKMGKLSAFPLSAIHSFRIHVEGTEERFTLFKRRGKNLKELEKKYIVEVRTKPGYPDLINKYNTMEEAQTALNEWVDWYNSQVEIFNEEEDDCEDGRESEI